jgi:hypothetical protein
LVNFWKSTICNGIYFTIQRDWLCSRDTHAKKYADRVQVTYEYMRSAIDFTDANYQK